MTYQEDYLDKMLNFVITHHSDNKEQLNKIPFELNNINEAKDIFKKVLEHETHISLQEKASDTENPILYSVNLDTDEPGIIIGKNTDKKEMLVYTKINKHQEVKKIKKQKIKRMKYNKKQLKSLKK